MKTLRIFSLCTILFFAGCLEKEVEHIEIEPSTFSGAIAMLYPLNESGVSGTVHFEKTEEGVSVKAAIKGLSAERHGFHIHQFGDCSALDGTSAGGHFNPLEKEHNSPDVMNRHIGDMGNITTNPEGISTVDYVDKAISIDIIIGRGVIIHAGEDDFTSQPSGSAGPRIACGVIGIQN